MIQKTYVRVNNKQIARVTFSLPGCTWADRVYLLGDFNDWNRTSHPFRRDQEGRWTTTIDLAAGQRYEFRYLCDGREWMNDRQSDGDVPNAFGSSNSLLVTDPESD